MHKSTGDDLSTILGEQTKILGRGKRVVITDQSIGVSQLLLYRGVVAHW